MKLRTQFVFLIIGIIAVPFLVSSLIVILEYAFSRGQEPLPNYERIFDWARREVPRAEQRRSFNPLDNKPPGVDVIVLGNDDTIAYSTVPALAPGTPLESGVVLDFIRNNAKEFHFQIDVPRAGENTGQLMILKVPRLRDFPEARAQAVPILMYSSIGVLVFSALMSYLILRSLNRSIITLEGATRRISEGDLDFELPVRGPKEIASLTRSFDNMRKALKEEYARRARFIMGVSHDLKTPLSLIQGYVEAIMDGFASDPEAQKKYLGIVRDKTENLEGMVEELIEFVKMETGEWRMTFRDVPLASFLSDISKRYSEDALILKREFRFSLDLPAEFAVPMDESLVSRAFENLLGNAMRYTPEGGAIGVMAGVSGDGVVTISISDTGIGIPGDEMGRIFDPFYRGTNSRREQGFGLGLTTVKSIIEGHGWSISVSSEVDKGTVFTITIPAPTPQRTGDAKK
jgi:signal transduction histidine kinase